MSREIKFRSWDQFNGVMSQSKDLCTGLAAGFFNDFARAVEGENNPVLMQFTGLRDKNGKEIYEGDILAERGHLSRLGVVRYEPNIAAFMVFVGGGYCHLNEGDWNKGNQLQYTEVISNIYENPELLEALK